MRKYKGIASKFFNEKVVASFPDWKVEIADISTGKVSLTNAVADALLAFDEEKNTFSLISIKIKTDSKPINNDSLMDIYKSMIKGVLS